MGIDIYSDPDLIQAAKELDTDFPGAEYDDSLHRHMADKHANKKLKKGTAKIIKKIIFHGVFYAVFVTGVFFLFRKQNISVFSSMIYGLTWFLVYIFFKPDRNDSHPSASRPYGKFMEY